MSAGTRRIAVLGSNSFSGADFIDLLLDNPRNSVMGVSRSPEKRSTFLPYRSRDQPQFYFQQADLNLDLARIIRLLDDFRPSHIVNFAAQSEVAPSWDHPADWYQTNVVALAGLTAALVRRPYVERYLHISSPEVYGSCDRAVAESAPLNPSTPYAASKAAADLHLRTLVKHFGFPCVTVRATNVYGAHQQLWKIIPRAVIMLRRGQRIQLHGGGMAVKSYTHIRDVSHAELLLLERGEPGAVYHVSPDSGHAVRDVVATICGAMGRGFEDSTESVDERPGQDAAYLVDSGRIRRELGWAPAIGMDEGLNGVIRWIDANWAEVQVADLEYVHRT